MLGEKYKVAILLLGCRYEKYLGAIKYEELKGNIEVVAVGDIAPYGRTLDGWRLCTTEEALVSGFDYLILAQDFKETEEAANTFSKVGIRQDRVLSIEVFGGICFDFADYVRLHHSNISIIAKNCWGGLTSHALGLKFLSPFVNLSFLDDAFLRLLSNLKEYMELELEPDTESEEAKLHDFPCAMLGDISIRLNHYKDFASAKMAWDERKKRINWDNLFIMMYTVHEDIAKRFEELPYERKVIFTPEDFHVPCQICLKDFNPWIENMEEDFWKSVDGVADGHLQYYNPYRLLLGDEDIYRFGR